MLFSKKSGKKEKILGYYILVFLVLCIAGLLRTILVNDKLIPFLFIFSIILSMSIIFYSFYIFKTSNVIKENLDKNSTSVFTFKAGMVVLITLITIPGTIKGIPLAYHLFCAREGSIKVSVEKKADYNKRYCRGGLYLNEYHYFMNNMVCGIQKTDFYDIKQNDQLILYGKKSLAGFTIKKYRVKKR
jgi:hypothetical protein